MQWLKTTLNEIYGLFVDDVALAASILVWLAAATAILRFVPEAARWTGLLLAVGFIVLLVESATRYARRHRKGR